MEAARQRGGWEMLVSKAKRILFPDVPMHVPTPENPKQPKVQHDPKRAEVAVTYLERGISKMREDLSQLEQTVNTEPDLFDPNNIESEINELLSRNNGKLRYRLWSF